VRLLVQIALVSLGSTFGGLLRWGVGMAAGRLLGTAFPYGTFIINISGSLFLGWFLTIIGERLALGEGAWLQADDLKLMIAVGFTGAYTTFSTFEFETYRALEDKNALVGAIYPLGSVLLGLVAVYVGVALARWR
jgi:fluoride exporter